MSAALREIIEPHREIHTSAQGLINQSKTDKAGAYNGYLMEIRPKVQKIGTGLTTISDRYKVISTEKNSAVSGMVVLSFLVCTGLGVLAVVFALIYAKRISMRISKPLEIVTDWSEALSTGIGNLDLDSEFGVNTDNIVEIERMTRAFKNMVDGVKRDVSVIQRVSEGDMTVFVDIKSDGDVLGRNLYHLVQNNDLLFANLLKIADSVASNAENIAVTIQTQAEQTSIQAQAVEHLSETIAIANDLAGDNVGRARQAAEVSGEIKEIVGRGGDKMKDLTKAVSEIQAASQKISGVMKSIDDIAFQTNILALNAAVEAARAGTAGKGFSVVAEEVRNLALKSAEAAKQSSALIENTIRKTAEGSRISEQTSEMFGEIVGSTNRITEVVESISDASSNQQAHIDKIHAEIRKITQAVTGNAATCEEAAAATQEMTHNAEIIRREMKHFNLRKRKAGKAYIPAEKAGDPEFIRVANENYRKKMGLPPA